jgi:hypothetical protein
VLFIVESLSDPPEIRYHITAEVILCIDLEVWERLLESINKSAQFGTSQRCFIFQAELESTMSHIVVDDVIVIFPAKDFANLGESIADLLFVLNLRSGFGFHYVRSIGTWSGQGNI